MTGYDDDKGPLMPTDKMMADMDNHSAFGTLFSIFADLFMSLWKRDEATQVIVFNKD